MPEFEDFLKEIRIITAKIEKITIKLERHLAQHICVGFALRNEHFSFTFTITTGTNAKWLKFTFDFVRTGLLIYLAIIGLT